MSWRLFTVFLIFSFLIIQHNLNAQVGIHEEVQERINQINKILYENPEAALSLTNELLLFAEQSKDPQAICRSYRKKSELYFFMGDFDIAKSWAEKALKLANEKSLDNEIGYVLNNLGRFHYQYAEYELALDYLESAKRMADLMNVDLFTSMIMNNLGAVYAKTGEKEFATQMLYGSLAIKEKYKDSLRLSYTYLELGDFHLDNGALDSSLYYFNLALNVAQGSNNQVMLASAFLGLANVYFQKNDFKNTATYLQEASSLSLKTKDKFNLAKIMFLDAKLKLAVEDYELAKSYTQKSAALAREIGSRELLKAILLLESEIYLAMNDGVNAYLILRSYEKLKDSILSDGVRAKIQQMKLLEETENQLLNLEMKENQLFRTRLLLLILILVLSASTAFSVSIFRLNSKLKKAYAQLHENKKHIESQKLALEIQGMELEEKNNSLQNSQITIDRQNEELKMINLNQEKVIAKRTKELKEINKRLTFVNRELDTFIYKTSHDIRGPLARLLGLCNVALMDVDDKKSKGYFELLHLTAKSLFDSLTRLLQVNEIKNHRVQIIDIEWDRLKANVEEKLADENLEKFARLELQMDKEFNVQTDHHLLETIIFHILENAARQFPKFSTNSNVIRLIPDEDEEHWILNFFDQGLEKSNDYKRFMKDIFNTSDSNFSQIGIGLYLVKLAINKLQGELAWKDIDSFRSLIIIKVPKSLSLT